MVLKENREINHRSSDGDHWSVDGQAIFLEMCAWFSPRPTPVSLGILLLLADPKQHRMKNRARARTPSISHDPTGIVVVDKTIAKSTRPSTIQLLHLKQNGSPLRFLHDNLFP
jgi:hypothetical protein